MEERRQNEDNNGNEKRLRVLMVAPSLEMIGGQAVQAARLLEHWHDDPQLEVDLLPINPKLPSPINRLQKVKYIRTLVTSIYYYATLLLRVRTYDVIHIFSASYLSFIIAPAPAVLVSKLYGKKIVLNYRSGEAEDHLRRWPWSTQRTINLVDAIVTPSGYLVEVFGRFGFSARSIYNIVEFERFPFRERNPLLPIFLSNRSLESLYNVACVLRAFALIQKRFPNARLTVAGDGPQRSELENLARELCLRNTEFVGSIAPERMPELYSKAHIYLNGSDIDNMPGSIIESLASGLPVVTTEAGGIPYIVTDGETGLLVRRGDFQAMAERAIQLLEDQAFASKLVRRARAECNKYSWAAVRNKWLELYREAAQAGTCGNIEAKNVAIGLSKR